MTCFKSVCVRNCRLGLELNGDVYNFVCLEVFARFVHKCYKNHIVKVKSVIRV